MALDLHVSKSNVYTRNTVVLIRLLQRVVSKSTPHPCVQGDAHSKFGTIPRPYVKLAQTGVSSSQPSQSKSFLMPSGTRTGKNTQERSVCHELSTSPLGITSIDRSCRLPAHLQLLHNAKQSFCMAYLHPLQEGGGAGDLSVATYRPSSHNL